MYRISYTMDMRTKEYNLLNNVDFKKVESDFCLISGDAEYVEFISKYLQTYNNNAVIHNDLFEIVGENLQIKVINKHIFIRTQDLLSTINISVDDITGVFYFDNYIKVNMKNTYIFIEGRSNSWQINKTVI